MSDGEMLVTFLSIVLALIGAVRWYLRLMLAPRLAPAGWTHSALALALPLCVVAVFAVLLTLASWDVRRSPAYLFQYTVLGAAWLAVGAMGFPLLDLAWRDDALERRNPASALAVLGALGGLTACYSGGNVGDGPGWWCVVVAAGIGTVLWYLLWLAVEKLTGLSEAVSVERDLGAGMRLGALLLTFGLILGRAAAGDWISLGATLHDFSAAWPALPVAALAVLFERAKVPTLLGHSLLASAAWALVMVAYGGFLLTGLPLPLENPLYP